MKKYIFGSFILLLSLNTFAVSTTASEIILLPDGNIVLADVFIKQDIDTPDNRPKEISLNPRLNLQLKMYVQFILKQLNKIEVYPTSDWNNPVFKGLGRTDDNFRYYVVRDVKELRKYCPPGIGKNYILPGGVNVQDAVCTSGYETYFVEPIFTGLNLHEQALILIHEWLTRFRDSNGGRNLKNVGQLVNGLRKYLAIAFEQQKKQYRPLSEAELALIKSFFTSYVYLLTHNQNSLDAFYSDWDLHPNGGGLLFNTPDIGPESFISAQSALSREVNVTGPATIIDSILIGRIIINGKSTINNSTMSCLVEQCLILIGQNSSIENSKLNVYTLELGKNSSIKDSEMSYVRVKTGAGFNMSRAKILLEKGNNEEGVFQFNANQELKNGEIAALEFPEYAPYGVELEYPVLQFTDQKTVCFDENTTDRYAACFESAHNVPNFPYTSSNDGMEVIMTKADFQKNSRDINGHDMRLRTFDATIAFSESEKSNPKGKYMLLDGTVVRLGSYRIREFARYSPNFLYTILPHIDRELRKIGGSVQYQTVVLPIKASR